MKTLDILRKLIYKKKNKKNISYSKSDSIVILVKVIPFFFCFIVFFSHCDKYISYTHDCVMAIQTLTEAAVALCDAPSG